MMMSLCVILAVRVKNDFTDYLHREEKHTKAFKVEVFTCSVSVTESKYKVWRGSIKVSFSPSISCSYVTQKPVG